MHAIQNAIKVSAAVLIFLCHSVSAVELLWDANGSGADQTDGGGTWLGANQWWNGSGNVTWGTGDNATIGNGGAGGTITMGTVSAGSVTFTNFTGTYTLSSGGSLSQSGGITIAADAGNIAIDWPISGSGGITKNGSARMTLNTAAANLYTGTTTINGGVIMIGNSANLTSLGSGNLTLNGGVLEHYWGVDFTRSLGSGVGQVQILGGISGFSENGTGHSVIINNNASYVVVWGSAYFNPSELVLQAASAQANVVRNASLTFQNILDLNGATRTIRVDQYNAGVEPNGATISGVIRNNGAGPAGIIKKGVGPLKLTASNTFNGGVTINAGRITLGNNSALGSGGPLDFSGSGALDLASFNPSVGSLSGSSGSRIYTGSGTPTLTVNQSTNAAFYGSIQDGSGTVSVVKSGPGALILAGTNTYSGTTTVTNGELLGMSGGYCINSDITVNSTTGTTAAIGMVITNSSNQWTCASLTLNNSAAVTNMQFTFNVSPSKTLAPVSITGDLIFNGNQLVTVDKTNLVQATTYPLIVVGGTAPTQVPGVTIKDLPGKLSWGGPGNKTLSLVVGAYGSVISIR